ncbi:MAG: hypothetical protein K5767_07920 [Clostridia bacterium]|nr:hypothetical protein [Clostridia bacterium]
MNIRKVLILVIVIAALTMLYMMTRFMIDHDPKAARAGGDFVSAEAEAGADGSFVSAGMEHVDASGAFCREFWLPAGAGTDEL